ncbi:MAG: MerR family transcriptional regulator, heat shock protein HspR [Chloroflexia bacterium]|jgi:MerR family transcriptional regulator/heat shock protein HspR|nr:MerR family transcriptional regulator, heat shock protein HspR [Chloroflexia bacterium]
MRARRSTEQAAEHPDEQTGGRQAPRKASASTGRISRSYESHRVYQELSADDQPRYVISVAAQVLGVHPQTLRLYEREGLVEPGRTGGKIRLYSESDLERVRRVMRLTNDLGVNLAGAEAILNMRERMSEMRREMDRIRRELEDTIQRYRQFLDIDHE